MNLNSTPPPFGDIVLHHVTNDANHIYYPIHLLGIDLSITKHIIMLWIVCVFIITLALWGTRRYRKNIDATPEGLSSLFEIFIDFIKKDIIDPNIGGKEGKAWLPLITTFFLFILSANLLGMIPIFEFIKGGSATITGNFSVTLALANRKNPIYLLLLLLNLRPPVQDGLYSPW